MNIFSPIPGGKFRFFSFEIMSFIGRVETDWRYTYLYTPPHGRHLVTHPTN